MKNKSQRKGAAFEQDTAKRITNILEGLPVVITIRRTASQERWKTRTGDLNCFHKPHRCVFCKEHMELKNHNDMSIGELEQSWEKATADAQWKIPTLIIKLNGRFKGEVLVVKRLEDYLREKVELEGFRQKQ